MGQLKMSINKLNQYIITTDI